MAYPGCKECINNPALKCQKCKCQVCVGHTSPWLKNRYGQEDRTPYRLCSECYVDFLVWVVNTTYSCTTKELCCLINPARKCYLCKLRTCESHWHKSKDCPSWAKWKNTANSKQTNCCLKKQDSYCGLCGYPTCGEHRRGSGVFPFGKNLNVCRLCGDVFG